VLAAPLWGVGDASAALTANVSLATASTAV
jgi:hypothetical protein